MSTLSPIREEGGGTDKVLVLVAASTRIHRPVDTTWSSPGRYITTYHNYRRTPTLIMRQTSCADMHARQCSRHQAGICTHNFSSTTTYATTGVGRQQQLQRSASASTPPICGLPATLRLRRDRQTDAELIIGTQLPPVNELERQSLKHRFIRRINSLLRPTIQSGAAAGKEGVWNVVLFFFKKLCIYFLSSDNYVSFEH
jgi:hypothetical protein